MKRIAAAALLAAAIVFSADRSPQDLIDLVGRKGEISHLYDLYLRTGGRDTAFTLMPYGMQYKGIAVGVLDQIGLYMAPITYPGAKTGFGLRLWPQVDTGVGHLSEYDVVDLYPPFFGLHSGAQDLAILRIHDCLGADANCLAIKTDSGGIDDGDRLEVRGPLRLHGGFVDHGAYLKTSKLLGDTDRVLLVDLSGLDTVRDTLPAMFGRTGMALEIYQYPLPAAVPLVLCAKDTGRKIDGKYDCITMESNIGDAYIKLKCLGVEWKIEDSYERGTWASSLVGDSGTVADTALYERNRLQVTVSTRALTGTSTSNFLSIAGMSNRFAQPLADTSRAASWSGACYDSSQVVQCTCTLELNGSGANCINARLTWANNHKKGVVKGVVSWVFPMDKHP